MAEILSIQHERIDDVPLIIGLAKQLRMIEILDTHLGTHGLQQGMSNGQLAVGWLSYILSQADHRKSAVREWAHTLPHTLGPLLGQPLREVDFSDDRLGGVLRRLSVDAAWEALEQALWAATVAVYELPVSGVRLDSTTTYGYHQPREGGLMHPGHSKDHRPDLPQVKLMAAAAQPGGQLLACDVHPGQAADDPLYLPLIARVRRLLGREGLLYVGDCKMAALATRAQIAFNQDYYLMPLPLTGQTATAVETWVSAVVEGDQAATLIREGTQLVGAGYEWRRAQRGAVKDPRGREQDWEWSERVQVVRSGTLAQAQQAALEKRLQAAAAALSALTPSPGRGQRPQRDEALLRTAIAGVMERYEVVGLLQVHWQCQEITTTHYQGPGRPGPQRSSTTQTQGHYMVTQVQRDEAAIAARCRRLGWRVYVTNAPVERLSLPQAVWSYREGWVLERDFHLVKDLPLGLSPLFVWKEDQIKGLVRLLTLALRLLTLIESQVRQGLANAQQTFQGLYEGQPNRATAQPTAKRLLRAFARAQLTLTTVETTTGREWHLTALSALHRQVLQFLRLPVSLYTALVYNSS
jgi:transposase